MWATPFPFFTRIPKKEQGWEKAEGKGEGEGGGEYRVHAINSQFIS